MKQSTLKHLINAINGGILISTIACSFAFPEEPAIFTAVALSSAGLVANELILGEPRKSAHIKKENKVFLKVGTIEKNEKAEKKYEKLHSMESQPKFRGDHRRYECEL